MNFVVFDTETTGIPKHPRAKDSVQPSVIEFAAVRYDSGGELLEELEVLIDPQKPLEEIITKITGLTDESLKGKPTFEEAANEIRAFIESGDAVVAHNLPFDMTMLDLEFSRLDCRSLKWPRFRICTVQEFAEQWGRRPKLLELYEEEFGEPLDQTHRALDDTKALAAICLRRRIFDVFSVTN